MAGDTTRSAGSSGICEHSRQERVNLRRSQAATCEHSRLRSQSQRSGEQRLMSRAQQDKEINAKRVWRAAYVKHKQELLDVLRSLENSSISEHVSKESI
jgi:hypothetical protein